MNSLIRFYFKINPDELSDDDFARVWNDLQFALKFENNRLNGKQWQTQSNIY